MPQNNLFFAQSQVKGSQESAKKGQKTEYWTFNFKFWIFYKFSPFEAKIGVFSHFWPVWETQLSWGGAPEAPEFAHYFF